MKGNTFVTGDPDRKGEMRTRDGVERARYELMV